MDKVNSIDTEIFLFLNSKHNEFFDLIMFWASEKYFWIPLYAILLIILIKAIKAKTIETLIAIALSITLSDQTSNLVKDGTQRLRPSHEPKLEDLIHLSEAGRGGMYSFFSAHAANAFALVTIIILVLPKKYLWLKIFLIFWAILVSYSRIYNGVHYPLDVLIGALVGTFYGIIVLFVVKQFSSFIKNR